MNILNVREWKLFIEGAQFVPLSWCGKDINSVRRLKDDKVFELGFYSKKDNDFSYIHEFKEDMKHVSFRFVLDGEVSFHDFLINTLEGNK
jgi:hypothetical protein